MASNRRIALPQVWTLSPGEIIWEPAIAAVRFLALTGWRSGEVLALRWSEIDLARRTATLADIKTDRRCGRFPTRRAACCMTSIRTRLRGGSPRPLGGGRKTQTATPFPPR